MNFTSKQELFDFIGEHLIRQGRQALGKIKRKFEEGFFSGCAYRTEEGLKCAVGCIIPDDVYHPGMENLSVISLIGEYSNFLPDYISINKKFLDEMQCIHDYEGNWPDIKEALINFGIKNKLNTTYIESINI